MSATAAHGKRLKRCAPPQGGRCAGAVLSRRLFSKRPGRDAGLSRGGEMVPALGGTKRSGRAMLSWRLLHDAARACRRNLARRRAGCAKRRNRTIRRRNSISACFMKPARACRKIMPRPSIGIANRRNAVIRSAQFNLGVFYETGQVVPQNFAEAVKWYRAAAEQECAPAQCNLGLCYQTGRGVEQNTPEAVKWFIRAARQGDKTAQHNLGLHYASHGSRGSRSARSKPQKTRRVEISCDEFRAVFAFALCRRQSFRPPNPSLQQAILFFPQ